MIETLMALWNRGVSGRFMVMVITFFCICISISLLFVTVGGAWGSLFAHGHPGSQKAQEVNSALITATAPTTVSTVAVVVKATPTSVPNPCLVSPTGGRGQTARANVTKNSGHRNVPTVRTPVKPVLRHKTPTAGITTTPEPTPTLPPVSPTVGVTPTATVLPTMTPTAISTATVIPTVTDTVTVPPTVTDTPGASPTSVPTATVAPIDTTTPDVTPTATTIITPTVTQPGGSPTVVASVTSGTGDTHITSGGTIMSASGTPSSIDSSQTSEGNCLGDNLTSGGMGAVLAAVQNFLWVILVTSLMGTGLFCAQMYRVNHKISGG